MAAPKAPKPRVARRRWPAAEKRRIVELTLRAGTSVLAIANEHSVHPNCLYQWRTLYRTGKLDTRLKQAPRVAGPTASATFLPVNVMSEVRRPQSAARPEAAAIQGGIIQVVLASGATLRIESGMLDAALVCALVAELRR